MDNFNMLFPDFAARCADLRALLLPVAYVFLVGSMIATVATSRRSVTTIMLMFGRMVVCVVLLTQLPSWGGQLSRITDTTVKQVLKADPADVYNQYNKALQTERSATSQASRANSFLNLGASFFEYIVKAALWLFGLFASVIMFYAYVIQAFILYCGYALSPIFIAFLATRSLIQTGFHYLMGLVGVALWPLGWGVASLLTGSLINFMTDQSFVATLNLYAFQNYIGLAFIGFWIVFSTIAAPLIIQKTITSGAQAGAALVTGAFTAATMGVVGGVSAAAAYGSTGSVAGLATGAAMGAVGGVVSTVESTLSGYQYSPTGSMITGLGQMRSSRTSRPKEHDRTEPASMPSKDDLSGDQAARDKIKGSKNPHSGTS